MNEPLDIARLLELRKRTRAVAQFFQDELTGHLVTLTPLFSPRAIFGRHIRGADKTNSQQTDAAFAELEALYAQVNKVYPLNLRESFDRPMELLGSAPSVQPLQYQHEAQGTSTGTGTGTGTVKSVTVTTPLRWALSYANCVPDKLRLLIANQGSATGHELEQCVLNYLMLQITLQRRPGIGRLFNGLRLNLRFDTLEEFGAIPIALIEAPIPTFRPPDDIIIESTEVSGGTTFEEIINISAIAQLPDPLREKLESLTG